jgi:small-conductance mechanosensitive channel
MEGVDMDTETLIAYGERAGLALLVFVAALIAGEILSLLVRLVGRFKDMNKNRVYRLVAGTINTGIIIAGFVAALGTLGVNVTAMVAGLGLTGFAVGFALKDAVSNLVSGLMIVMYSPFDLGDEIEVAGVTGKVSDINLRYVTVKTDTESVLIPNGNFVTNTIKKKLPVKA